MVMVEPDSSSRVDLAARAPPRPGARPRAAHGPQVAAPRRGARTGTIRPPSVCVAMPRCTARCRWTTPASSSKRALICGKSAQRRRTSARIRNGSSVSLAALGRALRVELRAQRLELGDVDLLDVGEVRDAALGVLHLLRDLAAQADDRNRLDLVAPAPARPAATPPARRGRARAQARRGRRATMRPPGPLPVHRPAGRCRAPQARRRTAGEATGARSDGDRGRVGRRGARRAGAGTALATARLGRLRARRLRRRRGGRRRRRGARRRCRGVGGAARLPRCPRPRPRSGSAPRRPRASARPRRRAPAPCRRPATESRRSPCRSSRRRATWSSATVSPASTCQATSSTSAMPSPMSGILMTWTGHHGASITRAQRLADALRPREVRPLLRVRIRRVPAGDALDRRLEVVEAVLLHQRRQLGAEAAGARRLVHDRRSGRSSSPTRRSVSRSSGQMRAQVDDLGVDAGLVGRRLGDEDHRAVGEHRDARRRRGTPSPIRAAPCSSPRAPRPADASTTARPAGRGGRRTGRCRGAWARGRSPGRRSRSRRSAGPWRRTDSTASRCAGRRRA